MPGGKLPLATHATQRQHTRRWGGRDKPLQKQALRAIEDSRFYQHGGVDFKGVARAVIADLSGGLKQGASTITMQVARDFYLTREKLFSRKTKSSGP